MIYQNNMEIKCIITDDEPIARKGLRRHIGKIDFLTIVGECEDAIQLNNMLNSVQADLLFLDIEMPDMSGLDFLESAQNAPKVIITSAYERYALRGYEFDVVDYLLKPISFSRFLKSVNKAHALMESTSKSEEPAYIFVKTEKQLKRFYLKEKNVWLSSFPKNASGIFKREIVQTAISFSEAGAVSGRSTESERPASVLRCGRREPLACA